MTGRPVALVTGAARGIGRAAALALAGRGYDVVINYSVSEAAAEQVAQEVRACGAGALVAGADVADEPAVQRGNSGVTPTAGRWRAPPPPPWLTCGMITHRSAEGGAQQVAREARACGAGALVVGADVADETAVRRMVATAGDTYGRIDALINNAGTTIDVPPSDLDGLDLADWDRVFAVNVRGVFCVTRACVPLLRAAPQAAVVNTASIAGLRPGPQPFPYAASKAAVVNLTKTLAGALGPEIRVNAVAPGWMEGDWMQARLGENYGRLMERRARMTPLGRCVTAEDVAATIVSLVTSNPFVTGEVVVVDGGYSATT
jgi:3-oxoacyl-[acyl-carrier protein] reductase